MKRSARIEIQLGKLVRVSGTGRLAVIAATVVIILAILTGVS